MSERQRQSTTCDDRDGVVARVCAGAWRRSDNVTARLVEAGFGDGRWPGFEQLAAVPLLHKKDLHARQEAAPPLGGLAGCTPEEIDTLFYSPGGIAEPRMPSAEARLAQGLAAMGFGPGDRVLNGFSYHFTPAGLLFHFALRALACTVLPVGPQNGEAAVELAARARATGFVGITSHLKRLVRLAEEDGHSVGPGNDIPLKVAAAGAEPFGAEIRWELHEGYGIAGYDIYGSGDLGIVAAERPDAEGLVLLDGVVAEVLDPESGVRLPDGTPGHLVLTVDNPAYPLLRFGTGDISIILPEPAPDDRQRIAGVLDRIDDALRVRGMLLYGAQVAEALKAHPAIEAGWVEVTRAEGRDGLAAYLTVSDDTARGEAERTFAERFQALCRLRLDSVHPVDIEAAPKRPLVDRRKVAR